MIWLTCLAGIWLVPGAEAQSAGGPTAERVVADFESGALAGWQSSMSGEYYQGGQGQKGLSVVADLERGGKVLQARVRWEDETRSEPVFIAYFLPEPIPAHLITSVSLGYHLSAYHLDPRDGFRVRLRTSPTSFTDYAGTPLTIRGSDNDQQGVLPPDADDQRDTLADVHGLDLTLDTSAGPVRIVFPEPERRAWLRDPRKYDMRDYRLELHGPFDGRPARQGDRYAVVFEAHLPAPDVPDIALDALRVAARVPYGVEYESAAPVWDLGSQAVAGSEFDFEAPLPDLESGSYWLDFALGEPGEEPVATDAVPCYVVDSLDRERFFPIISILGTSGSGHMLDETHARQRVENLWETGFNTIAYTGATRFAAKRGTDLQAQIIMQAEAEAHHSYGMASILEYTHSTRLSREGTGDPSPFAPDSMDATRRHVEPCLTVCDANSRLLSAKVVDELPVSEAGLDQGEDTRRAFSERYGGELRRGRRGA